MNNNGNGQEVNGKVKATQSASTQTNVPSRQVTYEVLKLRSLELQGGSQHGQQKALQ